MSKKIVKSIQPSNFKSFLIIKLKMECINAEIEIFLNKRNVIR